MPEHDSTVLSNPTSETTLLHRDGTVRLTASSNDTLLVDVTVGAGVPSSPRLRTTTSYPTELVQLILGVKGPGWLCDEIDRDEDPTYVESTLRRELSAYVQPIAMAGKRILDFGCGAGASTMVLARMFPDAAAIVGIDFVPSLLEIASARCAHHGYRNVSFDLQASPEGLPEGQTGFDLIVLSAVVEHMWPAERASTLPALWRGLNLGGYLLVTDTPHRWFPIEAHTTNLWGLNYQSDAAAFRRALKAGGTGYTTWPEMLRAGIRGSTEREIVACLTADGALGKPRILRPHGDRRRVDLWYDGLTPGRRVWSKKLARMALDVGERLTGSLLTQNVTMCLQRIE